MSLLQRISIVSFILLATMSALFAFALPTHAATITVDSTTAEITADGECNLAEAIENANDDAQTHADCLAGEVGTDTISFAIDDGGSNETQIITAVDAVYDVSSPIIFNGLTQGNASCGVEDDLSDRDIDIELQGISFRLLAGADDVTIQGISMLSDSTSSAVHNTAGIDGLTLRCSHFGINAVGDDVAEERQIPINISEATNILIGGETISDTNLIISGNNEEDSAFGIIGENVTNLTIQGNWFDRGIDPADEFAGADRAITLCGPDNCGQDPAAENINVVIDNNIMTTTTELAIDFSGVTGLEITHNIIQNQETNALYLVGVADVLIQDNTLTDNGYGAIWAINGSNIDILDNHISGNGVSAIIFEMVDQSIIQGNLIGTDETGTIAYGNGFNDAFEEGVAIIQLWSTTNIIIGGDEVAHRNIISGNDDENVGSVIWIGPDFDTFDSSENIIIQGNYMGFDINGVSLPNSDNVTAAILVFGTLDGGLIGGVDEGQGNLIQSSNMGIVVIGLDLDIALQNISILGNSIISSSFAIDFIADTDEDFDPDDLFGANPNDAGDVDTGPHVGTNASNNLNTLLNHPVILETTDNGDETVDVIFELDLQAGDYRIEFFQNSTLADDGYGPGEEFILATDIEHDGNGAQEFTVTLPVVEGEFISATNTVIDEELTDWGFGPTSEFGNAFTVFFVVAPTSSSGSSTPQSRALAQQAFADYYASKNASSEEDKDTSDILNSGECPANLIVTNNMKQGDRDGNYSTYNNGNVTQVALLQTHINRILASQYDQAAGPIDGIFGKLTKQGVERLQTALNTILTPTPLLAIDGIVGPFTKDAINNSCGEISSVS